MTLDARTCFALTLALSACGGSSSSVTGTAGEESADTEFAEGEETGEASTGSLDCPPLELLDPGELLPDGRTLEDFEAMWAGSYQAGIDWDWAVDGATPPAYAGVSDAVLELDVAFAQRLYDGCEEVALEVESQLRFSTADGAFDEVWTVRWAYDERWTASLSLPAVEGELDYAQLGSEVPTESVEVDFILLEPGAMSMFFYAQGSDGETVFADGLAASGGVRETSACVAFNEIGPSCLPAGCAPVEGIEVLVVGPDSCLCETVRTLCLAEPPEPAPPSLYWREDAEMETQVFAVEYALPEAEGWMACAPGDAPACACEDAC